MLHATAEEAGRLLPCETDAGFCAEMVGASAEMREFAFGHLAYRVDGVCNYVAGVVGAQYGDGAGHEVVAPEHGGVVVPHRVERALPAAHVGVVDDVVVCEGREVEHFHRGGHGDKAVDIFRADGAGG